jgi:hypothetical protein
MKHLFTALMLTSAVCQLSAQSNGNGFYTKFGFNGNSAGWSNMKAVVNDYGATHSDVSYDLRELSPMMGLTGGVGFAFDNWNVTWVEGQYYTSRCMLTVRQLRSPTDTSFSTFSFVQRQFGGQYGVNFIMMMLCDLACLPA